MGFYDPVPVIAELSVDTTATVITNDIGIHPWNSDMGETATDQHLTVLLDGDTEGVICPTLDARQIDQHIP